MQNAVNDVIDIFTCEDMENTNKILLIIIYMDRLYVSRKKGGRGLRSIADGVALEKASLAEYMYDVCGKR